MIKLRQLAVGYGSSRCLLPDVNARFEAGRLVALLGRNGSGKSTLLKTMAGLLPPISGDVVVEGQSITTLKPRSRSRLLAYVNTSRVSVAGLTCRALVGLGRAPYTDWLGNLAQADREIVERSLRLTGMERFAERCVDSLSDGETQRVMVARALAQETPVMLLDEPTSFLDLPGRYSLGRLLKNVAAEGKTVIFSTHELDIALTCADDIALIGRDGTLTMLSAADMALSGLLEREFAPLPFSPATLLSERAE